MSSNTETGHAKNVANFKTLTTYTIGFSTRYNPAGAALATTALTTKGNACDAAVKAVEPFRKPFKDSEDARKNGYAPVNSLVQAAYNILKSSDDVPANTLTAANNYRKKIIGSARNKKDTPPPPPGTPPPEPAPDFRSVSQASFDMRLANFNDFIALLANTPQYAPNEADLTPTALQAVADALPALNDALNTTYQPFSKKLTDRDTLLYFPKTGMYDIASKVKSYCKGNTALTATEKKLIAGLKFSKPSKKELHF